MIVERRIRIQGVIVTSVMFFIVIVGSAVADEIELLLPDNNVSSKPILEFRARAPTLKPPSPGHSFIFLGRELDNGNTIFSKGGGFYPENDTTKNLLLGPGKVKYTLPDLKTDKIFRVQISQRQERLVNYILDNWNTKSYAFAWQNCVSLERDVARSIGLVVPEFNPADLDAEIPIKFIEALRAANLPDAPLKFDALETRRMDAVRHQRNDELKAIQALLQGRQKESQERLERARQSSPSAQIPGGGVPSGAGTQSGTASSQPGGGAGADSPPTTFQTTVPSR